MASSTTYKASGVKPNRKFRLLWAILTELSTSSCSPRTTIRTVTTSVNKIRCPALASLLSESALSASLPTNLPMRSRLLHPAVAHLASHPLLVRVLTPSVPAVPLHLDNLLRPLRARLLDNHRHWVAAVVLSDSRPHLVEEGEPSGSRPHLVRAPAPLVNLQPWARIRHQVLARPQPWVRSPAHSEVQHSVSRRSPAASVNPRSLARSPTHSLRAVLRHLQAPLVPQPYPAQALLELLVRQTTPPAPSVRIRSRLPRVRLDNLLLQPA